MRGCPFVAPAATRLVLLLLLVVGPEQKPERRPAQPMTRLVVGEVSGEPDPGSVGDRSRADPIARPA
jgi:hypothetical protein